MLDINQSSSSMSIIYESGREYTITSCLACTRIYGNKDRLRLHNLHVHVRVDPV